MCTAAVYYITIQITVSSESFVAVVRIHIYLRMLISYILLFLQFLSKYSARSSIKNSFSPTDPSVSMHWNIFELSNKIKHKRKLKALLMCWVFLFCFVFFCFLLLFLLFFFFLLSNKPLYRFHIGELGISNSLSLQCEFSQLFVLQQILAGLAKQNFFPHCLCWIQIIKIHIWFHPSSF